MVYCSIDIETTGLSENNGQIIEFAAIIEDSNNIKSYEESHKFRRIILSKDGLYNFSPDAAIMNADLIKEISSIEKKTQFETVNEDEKNDFYWTKSNLYSEFIHFLQRNYPNFVLNDSFVFNKKINVVGKNFKGFDEKWLIKYDYRFKELFHYRAIDPTAYYINWKSDEAPPGTSVCKKRANLGTSVVHKALDDAWDMIQLCRERY